MKKIKVAVIGSGISGISSSLFLSKKYDVHLFEKNDYLGGHTRTKRIEFNNIVYNIDTGFIVFNEYNYDDLIEFFKYLKIKTEDSNMSFSISIKNPDIEYGSNGFKSIFADKKKLVSVNFLKLIFEIIKLYKHCKRISDNNEFKSLTIDNFLNKHNYSKEIKNYHIYPMISSIWSCDKKRVKDFPLISFINFFENHKLFNFFKRPQWKFVKNGSKSYIDKIIKKNLFNYSMNKEVDKIYRNKSEIKILFKDNSKFYADKVIIATNANQALKIINKPTKNELQILSKFKYSTNFAYLHSDINLMPKRKKVWSSWNFLGNGYEDENFSLTYWMNSLQNIKSKKNFFVSINPKIIPKNFYDKTTFQHPVFNLETLTAQKNFNKIQGLQNTWFCGSYLGYGFHEDGIQSACFISKSLNIELPWDRSSNYNNRLSFLND